MSQKKRSRNLSLLYYFVIERNIRMQTTRLRAIMTVRIMAPHPQAIKITQIAAHPLLLQQLPLKILPHPLQKNFAPCEVIQPSPEFSILHCGRCGFRIPGTGSPDSLSVEFGFRISIVCRIPDNSRWTTDSKAQDAGFHMQTFPRFWIPQAKISPTPESGVPDMGQSTDSHWIVRT
ncbi:unnamed protein product [Porites lobata]|uniref:Uncharacterized protein n=1 Tax=Porites lobata TaxID=104759 RepID=A0ABN8R176_9CNID|nr:unnamed protein product [Porites lobata]